MKILFMTRRVVGVSADQIATLRLAEAAAVWKLVAAGFIREIYFSPGAPTVIGIVECENVEAARRTMRQLPMLSANLIDFDFHELQPYNQFALLFGKQ